KVRKFFRRTRMYDHLALAHMRVGDVDGALARVMEMEERGLASTSVTWALLVRAYCLKGEMEKARELFDRMGPEMRTLSVYGILIHGYINFARPRRPVDGDDVVNTVGNERWGLSGSRRRDEVEAEGMANAMKVFDQMIAEGRKPDVIIYNVLMSAHNQRGEHSQVLKLFETMIEQEVMPDVFVYNTLIHALVSIGEFDVAKALPEYMEKNGLHPDAAIYETLMNGYAREGNIEAMMEILQQMRARDWTMTKRTYAILIHGYCNAGELQTAWELFDDMIEHGIPANLIAFNTLIQGHCKSGDMQRAEQICLELMPKHGVTPAVTTFNTIIAGYVRHGNVDSAMAWYDKMVRERAFEPNLVTFNILLWANAKRLNAMGATEILSALIQRGFMPDDATFGPLIGCYTEQGDWRGAKDVVAMMESSADNGAAHRWGSMDRGIVGHKSISAHNILLAALRRNGSPKLVINTFLKILGKPPEEVFALVDGVVAESKVLESVSGDASEVDNAGVSSSTSTTEAETKDAENEGMYDVVETDELSDVKPEPKGEADVRTFDILIRAHGTLGELFEARQWFDKALAQGIRPDVQLFNALLYAHTRSMDIEGAEAIIKEMHSFGVTPNPFSYAYVLRAKALLKGQQESEQRLAGRKGESDDGGDDVEGSRGIDDVRILEDDIIEEDEVDVDVDRVNGGGKVDGSRLQD
ncbi:hypothetical protein HDU76_002826, partial [Blyttiomyces sp. JEL0837]